jgi:hypothetical protein
MEGGAKSGLFGFVTASLYTNKSEITQYCQQTLTLQPNLIDLD